MTPFKLNIQKTRSLIRRMYRPVVALMFIALFIAVVGLLISGSNFVILIIVAVIAFGFLISFLPKYSYYGSFAGAYATVLLISLQLFVTSPYLLSGVIAASLAFMFLLHYFTRSRQPMSNNLTLILVVAYMLTTLLSFYLAGTQPGKDVWVIGTAYISILSLYVIPLDIGYRQKELIQIINIDDLEVYSKMADRLESRLNLTNNQELKQDTKKEIEKIVSNFSLAVDSFLSGNYEGAIIHACNVREGLNRVFHNWLNVDDKIKFLEDEFG